MQQWREQRLLKVREQVAEEAAVASAARMRTLERRRGERCETETESFVVSEELSRLEDQLPSALRDLVVSVIRGTVTRDMIDVREL